MPSSSITTCVASSPGNLGCRFAIFIDKPY
nr:MAG TPA: hypothetical protein [Caudoviricetes sp.]